MSETPIWSKTTAENIVRHRSGTYYLSAMVGGKKVRKSLKVSNLRLAKLRRDAELEMLRLALTRPVMEVVTVGDALAVVERRIAAEPDHRPATRRYYGFLFSALRESVTLETPGAKWSADDAREWWAEFAEDRSTSQANNGLRVVRQMAAVLIENGLRADDPVRDLKRMKGESMAVEGMPSIDEIRSVIRSIRGMKLRHSEESANFVEFLVWSGMRVSEARSFCWEHVLKDWLLVEGAKNRELRRVPINSHMAALLEKMQHDGAAGPIFAMKTPRLALDGATARLGMKHLRVHDLRHWFATHAIESGVDVPTVSRWLGHKDGGALAMRVYGHLRDDHSLAAAKRMG